MVLNCYVCQQQREFEKDGEDLICPVCGYEYNAGLSWYRSQMPVAPKSSKLKQLFSRMSLTQVALDVLSDKPKLLPDGERQMIAEFRAKLPKSALDKHVREMRGIEKELGKGADRRTNIRSKVIMHLDESSMAKEGLKLDETSRSSLESFPFYHDRQKMLLHVMFAEIDVLIYCVYAEHNRYDDDIDRWTALYDRFLRRAQPVFLQAMLESVGQFAGDRAQLVAKAKRYKAENEYLKSKILKDELGHLTSELAEQPPSRISMGAYATYPVFLMVKTEGPFGEWRDPELDVPDELESFFSGGAMFVQMWVFYLLTAQRYGYDFAEKVLSIQKEELNKGSDGTLGNRHENAVHTVQDQAVSNTTKPTVLNIEGKTITFPFEYELAIQMILADRGEVIEVDLESKTIVSPKGIDWDLARCLAHAKDVAFNDFERFVDIATIVDENSE